MELHYFPLSTYSQKVLIALKEKQISFTPKLVNLFNPDEKTAYRENVFPLGKIPLLVREDGWLFPESSIIIEYLDTNFDTGTQLIPDDKEAARQTRFFDRTSDLYLNDAVTTLLFQGLRPKEEQVQERIEDAKFHLQCTYGYYDQMLASKSWLAGENFSMADCAAIPPLFYAQKVAPFKEHENLTRYWEQALNRTSYKEVLEEAEPFLKDFPFLN